MLQPICLRVAGPVGHHTLGNRSDQSIRPVTIGHSVGQSSSLWSVWRRRDSAVVTPLPSPYGWILDRQYNGASNYSPQWGNYNNNDNNNNGYQNGYQPSSRGGYNYPPQGNNMRQAIMRDQEQRRLQYQQQMQQQQRRPEMNNQNPGPEGQPETTAGQTHQAAIEPASESDNSFSGLLPHLTTLA
ncbi:hypothetical protein PSTT_03333 [Puccinia striiformis]|uniref:Uncharacterized protein n=1 Tax=Puccinia striiformis TaxID=27350 RepID=A0A2S4VWP2_9BASI|nr:hypothetical protein PSTT_03333 [Puccinia striiformis]